VGERATPAAIHGTLVADRGPRGPGPELSTPEDTVLIRKRFDRSMPLDRGPRVNERITIRQVRLIDAEGNQQGVVATDQALVLAREAGLDLVEVAPNARPPVARIMDYGKYKYEQNKKAHESKAKQHRSKLKTVRLRPKTDPHMLEIRVKAAREFLDRGDKVQLMILFRGREMAHQEMGQEQCKQVATALEDIARVEQWPRMEGRRMTMLLSRK
jgi:translation initiation factor IF-3